MSRFVQLLRCKDEPQLIRVWGSQLTTHQQDLASAKEALSQEQAKAADVEGEIKAWQQKAEDEEAKAATYQSNVSAPRSRRFF